MARKPSGMEPATDIESWDAVPWFRKSGIIVFLLPVVIVVALTGDVFVKATERMKEHSEANVWRHTTARKAFLVVVSLIFTVAVLSFIFV